MEDLTKHQLILVALLVSFVTSIATGIFTVALMEQAPQGVTQTVNHIIQETVQKVAPSDVTASVSNTTSDQQASPSDEQKLEDAVAAGEKGLVKIQEVVPQSAPIFLGLGDIVSADGYIAADASVVSDGTAYQALLDNGATTTIDLLAVNNNSSLAFFKIDRNASTTPAVQFSSAPLGNSDDLKVGQSVVVLGGNKNIVISRGAITSLVADNGLEKIETDAAAQGTASPLITLDAQVDGLQLYDLGFNGTAHSIFLPINMVKTELKAVIDSMATSTQSTTVASTNS